TIFATITRSLRRPVQPMPGFAQCSVGSIDDVGTRNGCATSASTASTTIAATASVTTHSTIERRTGRRRRWGASSRSPSPTTLVGALVPELVAGAVARRADARADDRLLRALVQALASPLDGGEEPLEVHLERREHRVGPVLHLEPRLARLAPGLVDDVLRLPLRDLHDLGLRRLAHGLLAGLGEQPVDLALRLGEHLLPLLHDPPRLLDLLGDRRPHLVEDVVDLLAVDADLVGQGDGLRVVHEVVELVDQNQDVHPLKSSFGSGKTGPAASRRSRRGGRRRSTGDRRAR